MSFDVEQPSYKAFRAIIAERSQRVAAWVGAGLSRPAEIPVWPELRKQLTTAARSQATARAENSERDLATIAAIEKIESHWTAFDRLHTILGEPTFASQIRMALSRANDAAVPASYRDLWQLPLKGIITLNLDRFAARAFGEVNPGKILNEVDAGSASGQYGAILQSNTPLVLNAHGVLANRGSWVFTASEIDRLIANEAYKAFVTSLITTSVVLFIGISADDVASGGFLARLLQSGFTTGEHFWLTNRGDDETRAYANKAGIQPIYYSSEHGHDVPIAQFFADLMKFKSKDDAAPPVRHDGEPFLPRTISPNDSPNEIRQGLAALVDAALDGSHPSGVIKGIIRTHERAIHTAWFVSTQAPDNQFFSYAVERKIGEGGFGKVYLARDADGAPVALKVLRQEILENDDLVGSFRRGVRSMRILSTRKVEGMIPYIDAFELPPSVVMKYVDGPNLQQLKERGEFSTLIDVVRVARSVANIVHRGHMLPERVLHRDLRPANIMISDYYTTGQLESVVVLDFDLSWHKGSIERSIDLSTISIMGYSAPELVTRSAGTSSRSSAIDVFGLAMTIYYMMSGLHPNVGIIHSVEWERQVRTAVERICNEISWKSLPNRLIRLLLSCTRPTQSERPDMPSMLNELERLLSVIDPSEKVISAELLTEELAARAGGWREYTWNPSTLACSFNLPSGVSVVLNPNEVTGVIGLKVSYTETGQRERKNVGRYVAERRTEAVDRLKAVGWRNLIGQNDSASLGINANAPVTVVSAQLSPMASSLTDILNRLGMV